MTTISYAAAISTALSAKTKKIEIYGHLPPRQNRAAAVLTIHEDGDFTFSSSDPDGGTVLWLLEMAKKKLLEAGE